MKDGSKINNKISSSELPDIPGGWVTEDISFGDDLVHLTLPAAPDNLLEDAVEDDVAQMTLPDEGAPYWGYLWSAARTMAAFVLREKWGAGTAALELGSGIGLVGVAALKAGLQTTLSDYDPTSLILAKHNATQNGYPHAEVISLQWDFPLKRTYPVILGCEIIYEPQSHAALLNLLDDMLAPNGTCWLADGGRIPAAQFIQLATARGYNVSVTDANKQPLASLQRGKFQLLQLQQKS